jgi:DNA repair exonuclease SbcCD nuclease subunit
MANLFKKAAVMTDLHIGLKSNSIVHNEDCLNFVKWFIEKAKKEGCETAIICGDWHNHRASINIHSLHYSMQCLELLNSNFSQVFFLTGNHDLYYRDRRDVQSVAWAGYLPNVHLINDIFSEGDVTICPWLVGDEIKQIKKIKSKYTFGHFELPNFYMNAQVLMPEHEGGVTEDDLSNIGQVFSGHFHKRQARKNIWYIGNAFPHNYADAGDDARGMMILEWGTEPVFHTWPRQPVFRVHKLSDILENPEGLLLIDSHVRVHLDIEISYEEANFLRETWIPEHKLREMALIPMKVEMAEQGQTSDGLKFESVDQIIIDQINAIESNSFDKKILLDIYNNL